MFTGIVEAVGTLKRLTTHGHGAQIEVGVPDSFRLKERVVIGDSIANNGVCLTATSLSYDSFTADVSKETIENTCFKHYKRGQPINLELACTPSTHLGGHIMQGHVDGIGKVKAVIENTDSNDVWIEAPHELMRYIAHKGSIAVDGISLTVNEIKEDSFRLTMIPHTQESVAAVFSEGSEVNLEVDVLARYLERLFLSSHEEKLAEKSQNSEITLDKLMENGFF
ncbi:MAG: riboflavin synthase [Succinivibrio sp.]|nr:riboflavin synthase [Succinivibrio sp.]